MDGAQDPMSEAQITALQTRLGMIGVDKLWVAARRWAAQNNVRPPTKPQVKAAVEKRSTPQVFKQPRASKGHHVSLGPGNFQADLASFQAVGGTRNRDFVWCYCLVSVWNRKLWARPLKNKDPESTRDALREILDNDMSATERQGVKDITSDKGNEWEGAYREFLAQRGISQRTKDPQNRQGTAVIDRAIGTFKKMMYADMQQRNSTVWYNRVEHNVRAYNERPHSAVGAPPGEVDGNEWLEYLLLAKNSRLAEGNAAAWAKTKRNLEPGDRFRSLLPKKQRGFQRGYRPVYGKRVLTVQSFREQGRKVVATDGSVHSTARVLPIPEGSTNTSFQALDYAERSRREQVRAARNG